MEAILVQNLVHFYGSICALDHLSFSVAHGEVFGFLGPNGAGKTTTIRILTGQLQPTAGSAWVMGLDVVTERPAMKPQIGVVFEYQNLYERLSARENLNFSAKLYGVSRQRVEEVLEQTGLQDRANERVRKFSNGMKQRLLIGRALLHQPRVLFMDEPTRGLDAHLGREIRKMISRLAQHGVTIFLTTHYMEEADQLCDRVAILDHGRIVALDTPAQLRMSGGPAESSLEDAFVRLTGNGL